MTRTITTGAFGPVFSKLDRPERIEETTYWLKCILGRYAITDPTYEDIRDLVKWANLHYSGGDPQAKASTCMACGDFEFYEMIIEEYR